MDNSLEANSQTKSYSHSLIGLGTRDIEEQVCMVLTVGGSCMYFIILALDLLGFSSTYTKFWALVHVLLAVVGPLLLFMGNLLTIAINVTEQTVNRLILHGCLIVMLLHLATHFVLIKFTRLMHYVHINYDRVRAQYLARRRVPPDALGMEGGFARIQQPPRITAHTNQDRPLAALRQSTLSGPTPRHRTRRELVPVSAPIIESDASAPPPSPPPKVIKTVAQVHPCPANSAAEPSASLTSFYSNVMPSTSRSGPDVVHVRTVSAPANDGTTNAGMVQLKGEVDGYVVMTLGRKPPF